jgi:pantoate--beta-alanine ligase
MINENDLTAIKSFVKTTIGNIEGFNIEYFDIVDDTTLTPVSRLSEMDKSKRYFGCIAVIAGKIRLIDNIEIGLV